MTDVLTRLTTLLQESGLLTSITTDDGFVHGPATQSATGSEVMVNVDPDLEEDPDPDLPALVAQVGRVLSMPATAWTALLDEIATEVEDAVGDVPVENDTDLRDDLAARSVVVFPDAVLIAFDAPAQFPDAVVRVQLDADLGLEDLEIAALDAEDADDGIDTVTFDSLDELLDHLSENRD